MFCLTPVLLKPVFLQNSGFVLLLCSSIQLMRTSALLVISVWVTPQIKTCSLPADGSRALL